MSSDRIDGDKVDSDSNGGDSIDTGVDSNRIGTPALTLLVAASMIGAGVYTTSGFALVDLHDRRLVLLAWLLGGAIAIAGAASYGQLARRLTENGGEYLYLARAVHPLAGFAAGWVSLWAGFTAAGAFAVLTFEAYARDLLALPLGPSGLPALLLTAAVTTLHAQSVRFGVTGQSVAVAIKLSLLAAFLTAAAWLLPWDTVADGGPLPPVSAASLGTLARSVVWISFSYTGFNAAVYLAGDARDGARGVTRSMVVGTAAVTVLYVLLNAVFLYAVPSDAIAGQKEVATIAAAAIGGSALKSLVGLAICLGLVTTASSVVLTGPRVYARMADDGLFPGWFRSSGGIPRRAVLLQGVLIAAVVLASDLRSLLDYLGLTLALTSMATVATLLRRSDADSSSRWRLLAPLLYLAATATTTTLAVLSDLPKAAATAATFASAAVVYLLIRPRAARAAIDL